MDVRIVVCGLGRVGKAFVNLLIQKEKDLKERYGLNLKVVAAVDIGGAAVSSQGLPLQGLMAHLEKGGQVETLSGFGKKGYSGVEALSAAFADLLVETTPTNIKDGEPGLTHLLTALKNKKHVVTAAKGPLVLRYGDLKALAEKAQVKLMISAATAAALPTLDVGLSCLAGTEVISAEGILNGTTNYILTRMHEEGTPYADALAEAQRMGVAEPDPSLDVEGRDTGNKILLIANEVFLAGLSLKDISVTGITKVTPEEIQQAKKQGKIIKLIGKVERKDGKVVATVAPLPLPADHPLASVRGTEKGHFLFDRHHGPGDGFRRQIQSGRGGCRLAQGRHPNIQRIKAQGAWGMEHREGKERKSRERRWKKMEKPLPLALLRSLNFRHFSAF